MLLRSRLLLRFGVVSALVDFSVAVFLFGLQDRGCEHLHVKASDWNVAAHVST